MVSGDFFGTKTKGMPMSNWETDLVTVEEAAEILGLHRSQARAILGEPYTVWQTAAGRMQYVYEKKEVERIKHRRDEIFQKRKQEKGLKSCYYCHCKFTRQQLCDGLCVCCQARKIARNFACHGDCMKYKFDINRLHTLAEAIVRLETENEHSTNLESHPELTHPDQ